MGKISPDWQGCTQIFKPASDIAYTPILKLRLHLQHFRYIHWDICPRPWKAYRCEITLTVPLGCFYGKQEMLFLPEVISLICAVHLNLLRFQWIFCDSRKEGGGASLTHIASSPQFTHKHRVAATHSPKALPSCTPISYGKMSLLLNAYYWEMQR